MTPKNAYISYVWECSCGQRWDYEERDEAESNALLHLKYPGDNALHRVEIKKIFYN